MDCDVTVEFIDDITVVVSSAIIAVNVLNEAIVVDIDTDIDVKIIDSNIKVSYGC